MGSGSRYKLTPDRPPADQLLLDVRKERIEQILALRTRTLTVVLDRLEDTFNMAAVLRTCEGMGVQEVQVVVNPEVPFVPHPKVTQGCEKWLDVHLYESFAACRERLKSRGFEILASAAQPDGRSLFSLRFDRKLALVFGNERFGVSPEALAGSDGVFWIPMRGFTRSLNVSAAAAACVVRAMSWREEHLGGRGDLTRSENEALRLRFQMLSVKQRERLYRTKRSTAKGAR